MEKLEKITMKTMEFEGPSNPSDKKNKKVLQGEETPLLTDGTQESDETAKEKKKGFDFISMIKNFFKLKANTVEDDENSFEEDVPSDLTATEDEGMTDRRKAAGKKTPVSFPWRSLNVKNALVVMSLALIAVAGYINVQYYSENGDAVNGGKDIYSGNISDDPDFSGSNDLPGIVNNGNENDSQVMSDSTSTETPDGVSAESGDDYFSIAVISRQRSRDESIELLMTMLEKDGATQAQKEEITAEMSRIADEIASEVNIENLIKAKGMEECVAVISSGNANIIVRSEGLTPSQVAQIKEIVYLNTDIHPKNIKIIEKVD